MSDICYRGEDHHDYPHDWMMMPAKLGQPLARVCLRCGRVQVNHNHGVGPWVAPEPGAHVEVEPGFIEQLRRAQMERRP